MCERADLDLVMEPEQIDMVAMTSIRRPAARPSLFAKWLPKKAVLDPFNQSSEMFEAVYLQLEEAAQAWARKLNITSAYRAV